MKHIKLFESYRSGTGLSAVGVFLETQMSVGVFPTAQAKSIFNKLRRVIPSGVDYIDVEIVEIPEGHDLVIVPLGGKGISTSNETEMENYGDPIHAVVELGKFYDYGENPSSMAFRVNPDVNGFVVLDSAGGTRLVSSEEMEKSFLMGSQMEFKPEDISKPGDTVFCWNFEDGWEVALLDDKYSKKMYNYLESSLMKGRLVTEEIEYSSNPGIAFVTAGIPYDLSVNFVNSDFDFSNISYLINSGGVEDNPNEDTVDLSCILTLKKNHIIAYSWRGHDSTVIPIGTYLKNHLTE